MKKIMFGCLCAVCAFIAAGNTPASRQIAEDLRSRRPLKKTPVSVCDTRVSAFLKEHFGVQFGDPIEKFPQSASSEDLVLQLAKHSLRGGCSPGLQMGAHVGRPARDPAHGDMDFGRKAELTTSRGEG